MAPEHEPWWKAAVVYQIHPRSFADSDRDGIGDLPGIASRLDYLAALGVDVLWLSPVSPSPQDDVGYDISDCHAGARTRRSATGTGGARRATGCRPAWDLDPATGEYYLHLFSRKQPDLNWESPEVRDALVAGPRGRRLPHGREMHRAVVAGRDEPLLTVGEMPGGAGRPASPSAAGTASPGTTATSRASCRASATTARTACAPRRCSAPSCTCTAGRRTSTRARSSG